MRFITQAQIPQRVLMDSYPNWDRAPSYRVRLTENAAHYDDLDMIETDTGIQTMGDNVNHGILMGAGRLY